jgi:radical SAM protein with 4Fe4S-binding SPASM domain
MLAEMGNDAFKLGTVHDTYDSLVGSDNCKAACIASTLESLPNCCDCVYQPYCGTCPVVNFAISQDIYSREPNDYKCVVYKGIFDTIFQALLDPEKEQILKSWV